jgi:endonuclease III
VTDAGRWPFADVLERLKRVHGAPQPAPTGDPFELILWENCAYLANDARRKEAFARLKAKTGLDPKRILAAPEGALEKCVAAPGRFAALQAAKLAQCAELVLENHDGDLTGVLKLPRAAAVKALRKFPAIGEPGAEKILLFSGAAPVLALESNGLRALVRLGFGEESKDYRKTYRSVQAAVAPEAPRTAAALAGAHRLLRAHGQVLCTRSAPRCPECPLRERCPGAPGG